MNNFSGIIPCGIKEYGVTSITKLGIQSNLNELDTILEEKIKKIIGLKWVLYDLYFFIFTFA